MDKPYYQMGQLMFKMGTSAENLEKRIVKLGPNIDASIAREIVTGYVDSAVEASERVNEAYTLLHGQGRWLYNGDFQSITQRVVTALASETVKFAERPNQNQMRSYHDTYAN